MIIKYVPFQPHCFAFGGFEIQMLSTLDAVVKSGGNASKIDIWSRDNAFDILHCWGLGFHHFENIRWAKHAQKKVVLTALLSYYETPTEKIRHFFSTYIKKAQYFIEIANTVDAIVVVNDLQANICHKYFKVPTKKIFVVPNIINDIFFNTTLNTSFVSKYQIDNYILTVGSVCHRKNQLNLIKACIKVNKKLVIIGKLLEGEEQYGALIEKIISNNNNILWIKGISANSNELLSAYQNSLMVALPSYIEQQPITLLEGAAVQKPLLISNKAFAKQKYYQNAMLVSPDNIDDMANSIQTIINNPEKFVPSKNNLDECKNLSVGEKYVSIYKNLLTNK